MPKRCAFGCVIKPGVSYHQFPNLDRNPVRFEAWVHIVGGKLETQSDYEYYMKKVVCDIHFADRDKNRNNRLSFLAVPTLHLSGASHDISSTQDVSSTPEAMLSQPSASSQIASGASHDISSTQDVSSTPDAMLSQPSASSQIVSDTLSQTKLMEEHNYCKQLKKDVKKAKKIKYEELAPSLVRDHLITNRQKLKNLQCDLNRLRKRAKNFKTRLANAEKLTMVTCLQKLTQNMTTAAKIFTKMQSSQTHKQSRGRRFSLEEKVLSLSIYKKSPKCYTLLCSYFALPSAKTLKKMLAKIEIQAGLNKAVFHKTKETVKQLEPQHRVCCLIFDEMSITPQIQYDAAKDKLRGFAWRSKKFADHALVYMIKLVGKNYKQPVAYYFTNSLKKEILKELTESVIKYVQGMGLRILCTICDQSPTNVSTINAMIEGTKRQYLQKGKEWRHEIIEVGGKEIIPLFDVPHMIKCVRNNLLTKNLKYFDFDEQIEKTVKWEYYQKVYEADKTRGELKMLHKLTDEHLYADKIRKMKVKAATQVFSHSVAVTAEHLTARGLCPSECGQIVKFTLMFDKLFDSLNASSFVPVNGKIYKSCIKRGSPHHQLWIDAIKFLKTVTFIKSQIDKNGEMRVTDCAVPTIKNFIRTIEGMRLLWKILSGKYAFDSILSRNFNQDPLENFFGNIRSYGIRNTAPNVINFEGAYKSLLINNLHAPHSSNANCERDFNSLLLSLDFFLKKTDTPNVPNEEALLFQPVETEEIVLPSLNLDITGPNDQGQANYVCGWVLTKCLKNISKQCKNCKIDMIGTKDSSTNAYIRAKEYSTKSCSLIYPSRGMEQCFGQLQNLVSNILSQNVPKTELKEKIKMFADITVDYPFRCVTHKEKLKMFFVNTVSNIIIYSWCRSINRILSGKIRYDGEDETKVAAQKYYLLHSKRNK